MRWWTVIVLGTPWFWAQQSAWAQEPNREQAFADVFAAVLAGENPDGGTWEDAGAYLEAGTDQVIPPQPAIERALQPAINRYHVLIVSGFLSGCALTPASSSSVFKLAQEHLQSEHGVDVAVLQVPNDSCESNGKLIAKYLRQHARDGKQYIVIGYSKGAADLEVALLDRSAASVVGAFISIAGAVRGSPLADLPVGTALVRKLEESLGCMAQLGPALQSLGGDERRAFVASHPHPSVPSYSLVAASGLSNTSRALRATWWLLGAGLQPEDGALVAADGVLPGAKFLGTERADHVAIAQDFQRTALAKLFDKSHFPRTALLEALLRFVIADLENASAPQDGSPQQLPVP
jgi:hypothetical protein